MVDKKTLKKRMHEYLSEHPQVQYAHIRKKFRDDSLGVVRNYYYQWVEYVKPLRWLYNFMSKKWVPNKRITLKDKEMLRRIERKIGV